MLRIAKDNIIYKKEDGKKIEILDDKISSRYEIIYNINDLYHNLSRRTFQRNSKIKNNNKI